MASKINFPSSPIDGQIHTENGVEYIYSTDTTAWLAVSSSSGGGAYYKGNNGDVGGATGLGDIFRVHSNTITSNIEVGTGTNALLAGPLIISDGQTVTAQTGSRIVIV